MAEVQSRSAASRGRGSTRGRGGFSSRGGRSSAQARSAAHSSSEPSFDDQGELGQLKKQYLSQLSTVKEVFPDWTDDDIVFALQETNGDVQSLIERISEGNVFQFEDVKKKQPREKSRAKGPGDATTGDGETRATSSTRGGRARGGAESSRGGRGRGSERGRGSMRGGRGGASATINGSRASKAANVDAAGGLDQAPAASGGWDTTATTDAWDSAPSAAPAGAWDDTPKASDDAPPASDAAPPVAVPSQKVVAAMETQKPKSWASMFAKPNPPPAVPKPAAPAASKPIATESSSTKEAVTAAQAAAAIHTDPQPVVHDLSTDLAAAPLPTVSTDIEPPKVPLTEANVEHVPDISGPPPSETVASTRGDPQSAVASARTSLNVAGHAPIGRPSFGSLHKAATQSSRSLSFQRLKEQQDAVVMPGNHAVDRATVQFGQMGLGSTADRPLDVDDEREDAETRAQPPQQSPSAPRASLPPAARSQQVAPDQPPGLGLPPQQTVASQSQQIPTSQGQGLTQEPPGLEQYRYGAAFGHGQGQGAPPQKEYDPFSSQLNASGQVDARAQHQGGLSQAPGGPAQHASSYGSGYNQGPGSYESQYAGDQGRYSNYYGYGQHTSSAENQAPQRSTSGFGEQNYGAATGTSQSRFSEGQASGNNTPNPPMGAASHQNQSQSQNQHMHGHGHGQSNYGGGHPFGGGSPYGYYGYGGQYPGQGFNNHYGNYGQGYGSYGNKGGMYGSLGHHGYGMSSQGSFEHSSSPANTGTFGGSSLPGRDSGMSSNLNEYTRSGSTQPSGQSQNSSATGFGGAGESYGRSSSGFGGQSQGYGAQTSGATEESLKTLHEPKTGPSPGLGGGNNRPGSGFNANSGSAGYGPPQGGYGSGGSGFPGQLNQYGSSGYGLGGLGGHSGSQGHQGGYGSYGGGFGGQGSNYGGSGARGGWGSQYNQYGQH